MLAAPDLEDDIGARSLNTTPGDFALNHEFGHGAVVEVARWSARLCWPRPSAAVRRAGRRLVAFGFGADCLVRIDTNGLDDLRVGGEYDPKVSFVYGALCTGAVRPSLSRGPLHSRCG